MFPLSLDNSLALAHRCLQPEIQRPLLGWSSFNTAFIESLRLRRFTRRENGGRQKKEQALIIIRIRHESRMDLCM